MANSLTKSIMKNISKKNSVNNMDENDIIEINKLDNIRDNEEEILKNILYKNKSKDKLNHSTKTSQPNLKIQSLKTLSKSSDESSKEKESKVENVKKLKKLTTLKDLAK